MRVVGAACDTLVPSITRQYALHVMNALVVEQLCSDGLAEDHIVQQLFADDDACQVKLHEYAAKHASTTSTAPSSQNNQPDGQLGTKQTETTDQLRPAPLLSQPLKPWPQPSSKQWASIVMVANKASDLYTWLISPDQQVKMNTPQLIELQKTLLSSIARLLGGLVTGLPCTLPPFHC